MAMTFNEEGCRTAAANLNTSAHHLDTILNSELTDVIGRAKNIYQSATANELYDLYDKMKAKFPDFINAVDRCSKYLTETVAVSYSRVEKTAADKIN